MKRKLTYTILLCLIGISWASAQSIRVRGVVTSNDSETPLSNVAVYLKGTTAYTNTNVLGQYEITANKNDTLVFQYPGAVEQEAAVINNVQNVSLVLQDDLLDDAIVVGYTTANRTSYTGSAAVVRKEAIEKSQISSISKALQGNVAGLQSVSSSGQPGTNAFLLMRGIGSVNAATVPLYVVDGVPFSGDISSINPADVESITVLKDAAAGVIYGSRGANGIIVITTKQGRRNQTPKVDIKLRHGFSNRAVSDYEQVSTNEYYTMYWEALYNQQYYIERNTPADAAQYATNNLTTRLGINPYGPAYRYPVGTDGKPAEGATPLWNDSWIKASEQTAKRSEALISISGGGKSSDYFASFGYLNDQGVIIGSGFKRYSGRLSLNSDIKSWLKFSGNVSLSHSVQDYPPTEGTRDNNNIIGISRDIPSFYPVWQRNQENGDFILDENGNKIYDFGPYRPSGANPNTNIAGSTPYDLNIIKRDVVALRTSLRATLLEGLSFKSSFNLDYTNQNYHTYVNPLYGRGASNGGSVSRANARLTGVTVNNILYYNKSFGDKHTINALAGQEYYEYHQEYMAGRRDDLSLPYLYELIAGTRLGDFTGYSDAYKLLSFFGNVGYEYSNKYSFSASARTDGSSRFHPNSRWGLFWSLGASWRIANENFLQSTAWLSNLTLRASYGAQGNDDLNTFYAYKALYAVHPNLGEGGLVSSTLETLGLKWETNINLNVGLDFGLFRNRLSGTFEFFSRKSKDLLFNAPKAPSIGYSEIYANVGSLRNTGFEAAINGILVKTNGWEWSLFANLTHYKNKITALPQREIINGSGYTRMAVGGSVYDFFIPEWGGVNPADGLPQWYKTDSNGNRVLTTEYSEANTTESKINAGSALPDLFGGFGSSLSYKGLSLSFLFAYSIGGKIYNGDKLPIMHGGSLPGRAWTKDMLNRWTPENTHTDIPRLQATNINWTSYSTRFLVDATYLRLKNITLSYDLPEKWLSKVYITSCKLFVQGENLLTFFKEDGLDPEQTPNGLTNFRYPAMKSFSFGISLSF